MYLLLGLGFCAERKIIHDDLMRANDAFRGIVSDVFSFTFVQELLARQLGLEVGSYCHMVGSAHVYESDYQWAEKVIAEAEKIQSYMYPFSFPRMPLGDNWRYIHVVLMVNMAKNKPNPVFLAVGIRLARNRRDRSQRLGIRQRQVIKRGKLINC